MFQVLLKDLCQPVYYSGLCISSPKFFYENKQTCKAFKLVQLQHNSVNLSRQITQDLSQTHLAYKIAYCFFTPKQHKGHYAQRTNNQISLSIICSPKQL